MTNNNNGEIKTLFYSQSKQEKDLVVKVNNQTGCWEVISHKNGNPYPVYRKQRVHVLSYLEFNGEIPKGMVVRHTCDNPKCCNPQHLILGTIADNNQDKLERNRMPLKYSKELKAQIAKDDSMNYSELSEYYKVPIWLVSRIKNSQIKTSNDLQVKKNNRCSNKLRAEEVVSIYKDSRKGVEIAKEYNISPNTVYDIKHKRIWKEVLKEV